MEYQPNGWTDTGTGVHIKYALGYSIVIVEEPLTNSPKYTHAYGVSVFSIHGVERINQSFELKHAQQRADEWLHRKANEYSTELPAYEKAFAEGYSTRVMEEKHGYQPYEK